MARQPTLHMQVEVAGSRNGTGMLSARSSSIPFESRRIIVFCLLLFAWLLPAVGQEQFAYSPDAEQRFARAIQLFREAEYSGAASLFDELAKQQPVHQRTTAAFLMAAKSHFQKGEYSESASMLKELLNRFPESSYSDDAAYHLGLTDLMLTRYDEAMSELLCVVDTSRDRKLVESVLSLIDSSLAKRLLPNALAALVPRIRRQDARDLITLKLAEEFFEVHDFMKALQVVDKALKQKTTGVYTGRLRQYHEKLAHLDSVKIKIGVIVPSVQPASVPGSNTLAKEILDGVTFAADQFTRQFEPFIRINLEVRETERDTALSKRVLHELAGDKDVLAVIGPLFSDVAFACAPVANQERLALLSPTANEDGITNSGPFVFQLNPDLSTHGKAIARYAVQELGLRTLAVLAPREPMVNRLVEQFVKEAVRLQATVIAVESYPMDSSQLKDQFMNLRKAAVMGDPIISFSGKVSSSEVESIVRAGADRRIVDSLVENGESIGVIRLLGADGRHLADSLHLRQVGSSAPFENIESPATGIDGVFVPITDAEQMGVVASQMAYFNIKTQILGSGEWNDLSQLEAQKRYVNGVVFCSDTHIDREDSAYRSFEFAFMNRMNQSPTKYTLFGYDAMDVLVTAIQNGAKTREDIAQSLSAVRGFHGLHTTISFNSRRVNSVMNILRYYKGEIKKVAEVSIK